MPDVSNCVTQRFLLRFCLAAVAAVVKVADLRLELPLALMSGLRVSDS